MAIWSAAPMQSERGCLASGGGKKTDPGPTEDWVRGVGGNRHASFSQNARDAGVLSPLLVAASLTCMGFGNRQRTFTSISLYGSSPWIITPPSLGQTGTLSGRVMESSVPRSAGGKASTYPGPSVSKSSFLSRLCSAGTVGGLIPG